MRVRSWRDGEGCTHHKTYRVGRGRDREAKCVQNSGHWLHCSEEFSFQAWWGQCRLAVQVAWLGAQPAQVPLPRKPKGQRECQVFCSISSSIQFLPAIMCMYFSREGMDEGKNMMGSNVPAGSNQQPRFNVTHPGKRQQSTVICLWLGKVQLGNQSTWLGPAVKSPTNNWVQNSISG